MRPSSVTLELMLSARERRAIIQNKMLAEGSDCCLVCLTLNIAGDVKRTPMTKMLFARGVSELMSLGLDIKDCMIIDEVTGSEAFWLVRGDAQEVKALLEGIEDSFPAARLFDFDVLKPDGTKISRAVSRRCLICDRPAAECARSRAHGLDAVKAATFELLKSFCAENISDAAYRSLLDELYTTPKPGLVDLMSNGAHSDMDVPLFEKSAESLRPYFYDAAVLGMDSCNMATLRARGIEAEREMFEATGGINTHKGMIYSMGLLCAGMGMALTSESESQDLVKNASALAAEDAEELLSRSLEEPSTNGGRVLRSYGARGAMGEAAGGFPDAVYCAERLHYYMSVLTSEDSKDQASLRNIAGALAFCDSMAQLEDTNLLHRGGADGLEFARGEAARIAHINDLDERISELTGLDGEMIRRNLSPGGSADMLALAYLLDKLQAHSAEPEYYKFERRELI